MYFFTLIPHLCFIDAVQVVAAEAVVFTCLIFVEDGFSGVQETVFCATGEVS